MYLTVVECYDSELIVLPYPVLWLANVQARGGVVDHQSHIQTGPHAFHRYPTLVVLRRRIRCVMVGSAVQRGYRASSEEPYALQDPSQRCHRSMCIAYFFASTVLIIVTSQLLVPWLLMVMNCALVSQVKEIY